MTDQSVGKIDEQAWWSIRRGASPIVGTAIHDGHAMCSELLERIGIASTQRLREEDPFTGLLIADLPNQIVVHRSRFEVDLNRARDQAVYLRPEQAWGFTVWSEAPSAVTVEAVLAFHDAYYSMLQDNLRSIERRYGRFVVLDIHSYNHRRGGPRTAPMDPKQAPDVNIGTFSLDRRRWAPIVEAFKEYAGGFDFHGRRLNVQEDVAFQGRGEQARYVHAQFPRSGCALAVEFKKTFMDEWTGVPDMEAVSALRALLKGAVPVLEGALGEVS
ncbi:N-formylglutamate amidohydrolase [Mycoplana rhizolycopersici]|jgi:hypothetical protein|uniref:N-formylglutamate amidohydrolase n=1 Tax=Mycoplana rhizolycopersici TaxID=2746702 RepID=A0ABX2QP62_9HYPH|nr:N-formylglutamate amidohydrolase [Rhizobium rhizolycopersici]NVP58338.1 N-formylglutamate amidohydrolase [Rhizobium rhizolycopersici]